MSFSERMKLVPAKQIQTKGIDDSLRRRIINLVENEIDDDQAKYIIDIMGYRTFTEINIVDNSCYYKHNNLARLIALLEALPWNNVYDIIEYGYMFLKDNCSNCTDDCNSIYDQYHNNYHICASRKEMNSYAEQFNSILEQQKSGYRLIDGLISPIIGEVEIECIEKAINSNFHSVNTHLQKALQFYSDKENPDYENSIKESISAVEAMCCIITGMTGASATLGAALKKLEESGVVIHGAMRAAFSQLYGYASDADGIRHGGIDFKNAPSEDAKYMLVSCSAFINYLIEKHSKLTA